MAKVALSNDMGKNMAVLDKKLYEEYSSIVKSPITKLKEDFVYFSVEHALETLEQGGITQEEADKYIAEIQNKASLLYNGDLCGDGDFGFNNSLFRANLDFIADGEKADGSRNGIWLSDTYYGINKEMERFSNFSKEKDSGWDMRTIKDLKEYLNDYVEEYLNDYADGTFIFVCPENFNEENEKEHIWEYFNGVDFANTTIEPSFMPNWNGERVPLNELSIEILKEMATTELYDKVQLGTFAITQKDYDIKCPAVDAVIKDLSTKEMSLKISAHGSGTYTESELQDFLGMASRFVDASQRMLSKEQKSYISLWLYKDFMDLNKNGVEINGEFINNLIANCFTYGSELEDKKNLSALQDELVEMANETYVRSHTVDLLKGDGEIYGISDAFDYGFSKKDIARLACIFKYGNEHMKDRVLDLMTDCNFHSECAEFDNGKCDKYIALLSDRERYELLDEMRVKGLYNEPKKDPKISALAEFLDIDEKRISKPSSYFYSSETEQDCLYMVDNKYSFYIGSDAEAEKLTDEYLRKNLSILGADFICEHSKELEKGGERAERAVEKMLETLGEDAELLVGSMIDDIDQFVEDAIGLNGYGYYLAGYDSKDHEVNGLNILCLDTDSVEKTIDENDSNDERDGI